MKKNLPWILFGLSLAAAMYLLLLLLNAGSSLDDSRSEAVRLRQRSNLALSVVRQEWLERDVMSLAELSRKLNQQGIIVGAGVDSFEIGDFIFEISDGVVSEVRSVD